MHFDEAVRQLAARAGVPSLPPAKDGAVAVTCGELVVNLRPVPAPGTGFALDACLGAVDGAETVAALMTRNRWPSAETAGVLGMDTDGRVILVQHFEASHLSGMKFLSTFDRFIRFAARWRRQWAASTAAASQHAPASLGQGLRP